MKKLFLFPALLALTTQIAFTQEQADTELSLFVEDAQGNRDTVVIGYDVDASLSIDPAFGEEAVWEPFDPVLEVRAGILFPPPFEDNYLSKRLIVRASDFQLGCYSYTKTAIYIHAKHWPVKVFWKDIEYEGDCLVGTTLFNHVVDELSGPWDPDELPGEKICMASVDHHYFTLNEAGFEGSWIPLYMRPSIEWEVEGEGEQVIYGLRHMPSPMSVISPCPLLVSTREVAPPGELFIAPNPAADRISINLPDHTSIDKVIITNMQGIVVREVVDPIFPMDISALCTGVYAVIAWNGDLSYSDKLVVFR